MTVKPVVTCYPARPVRTSILSVSSKKRVCAYARVSTSKNEQATSYAAQLSYYTDYIQNNPDWEFVEVYADEAVTGTSTKKRDGFNRMIADGLAGRFQLIITKSVSRFARNTIDSLTAIRKLREKGIHVIFEEQGINTADSQGELLITLMSVIAQEESRSISENVTWGHRKRMQDGKVSLPYSRFLGYEKGEDGLPKIVESEAKTVRLIYSLFLQGKTCGGIAKHLTQRGILTPSGERKPWHAGTILSMLQNEKYMGEAHLQKVFTTDFLTKKIKKNEGEVPSYYVKNSHEGIIDAEVYHLVQQELANRKKSGTAYSGVRIFSSKIVCGTCGGFYSAKTWHSTDKYRKVIWRCGRKYEKGTHCPTPYFPESELKQAFVEVFNRLYTDRARVREDYEVVLAALTDTSDIDAKLGKLQGEYATLSEEMMRLIEKNVHVAQDQDAYQQRYNVLHERYIIIKEQIDRLDSEKRERTLKREGITRFLAELEQKGPLSEFDETVWNASVENIVVGEDGIMAFTFRNGETLKHGQ